MYKHTPMENKDRWTTMVGGSSGKLQKKSLAFQVVAMQASKGKHTTEVNFDTDSGPIGIDNRASACISHESKDLSLIHI